jgi:hypothetical protein
MRSIQSCIIQSRDLETQSAASALNSTEETNREDEELGNTAENLAEVYAVILIDVEE